MKTEDVPYEVAGKSFTGFLADGSNGRSVPGILVCHEANGIADHAKERARMLARLGYVAFALDLFGETLTELEPMIVRARALGSDLPMLRKRANAALDILRRHTNVDTSRLAAIGFCFGGTTALEIVRGGTPLACVVGFHSGLLTTAPQDAKNIRGKVLVCLGADDPVVTAEHRAAFEKEMREGGVDWQMIVYGGVGHSFTNPDIAALNMPGFAYDKRTDERSWQAMRALFDETMGPV